MKRIKKYLTKQKKAGYEIMQVSALINGIKYTFIGNGSNIFNSLGERII